MSTFHTVRFPGESAEYRATREELLRAEIELRSRIEEVAALRRALPLGGEVPVDYPFEEERDGNILRVRLSELFEPGKETLVLYGFMYGPEMEAACPSCTSILDGLDGVVPHVTQRLSLAAVAKSPIARLRAHARERGWSRLRLLSSARTTYNRDYHGETADGRQIPALNVFVRKSRHGPSHVQHRAPVRADGSGPGPAARGRDLAASLWSLFDLTPAGRPSDWDVALRYD